MSSKIEGAFEKTTKFSIKIWLKRILIRQLKRTINQCKISYVRKNTFFFCKNVLIYTINNIAMVSEIIISKFSCILKMMTSNTFPKPQPDSASYGAENLDSLPSPTCHISCGACHMSGVTCNLYFIFIFFVQHGLVSGWRVCYQRGLPRLVNRPGVASAVLQTPLWLINWLTKESNKKKSSFFWTLSKSGLDPPPHFGHPWGNFCIGPFWTPVR